MGTRPHKAGATRPAALRRAVRDGLASATVLMLLASSGAFARTGRAQAQVTRPLTLVNSGPLDFGQITAGQRGATVTVSPAGVRSINVNFGFGSAPTLVGGSVRAAQFVGMGRPGQTVLISTTTNSITLANASNARMTVNNFQMAANPVTPLTTTPRQFTISSTNGSFAFSVGGSLVVGANQAPGQYVGSFTVNIEYQ